MVKKTIYFDVMLKSSDRINLNDFKARQKVMTNDKNSVDIVFRATDVEPNDLNGATASIFLYMQDGSFFQSNSVVITNNILTYTMTQNQTQHKGTTKVQIVVKSGTIDNASLLQEFEISPGLEKYPLTEVMIQDWTTLTAEAKAFVDQIEDFTLESFVENKMGEELANLEVNYATRLTGLESADQNITAQLAQTNDEVDKKIGNGKLATMADIGQDIKESMTGGSVAVVGVNSVVEENIVDRQVTPIKTDFLEVKPGSNLFNKNDVTNGYYINNNSGQLDVLANYSASGFIKINPSTRYTQKTVSAVAFYDESHVYISGLSSDAYTTPTNASYVRISVKNENLASEMLVEGSLLPEEYIPFQADVTLSEVVKLKKGSMSDIGKFVGIENVTFTDVYKSSNLFDKTKSTKGFYINERTGQPLALGSYYISDFISIKPNVIYSFSRMNAHAYYDKDYVFLGGFNNAKSTSPENAAYLRFSIIDTIIESMMVVEGDKLPSGYIPYKEGNILKGIKVNYTDILNPPTTVESSYWKGKKWVAIGDSNTQYRYPDANGVTLNWSEDVAERLGVASLKRCAQEGKAMHEISSIMTYSGTTEQDLIDADLITVSLGQNDRSNALGVITDPASNDGSNFTGSTKWMVEYLLGINPNCTLVFITPTPSVDRQERLTKQADIIKNVCEIYSVPVFDLNRKSGFNTFNFSHFYVDSSVHQNGTGFRRKGRMTAEYLNTL